MTYDTVAGIRLAVPFDRPAITIDRVLTAHALAASTGSSSFLRFVAGDAMLANDVGRQSRRDDVTLPAGTRTIEWSVYCSYSAGPVPCQWASSDDVLHVYKVRLFLTENVAPSIAVAGRGQSNGAPGLGSATMTFDAEDADSGVQSVTARIGGAVVGGVRYACAGTDWSACQRTRRGQSLQLDTRDVPDGRHEVSIEATDAADNTTVQAWGELEFRNGRIASTRTEDVEDTNAVAPAQVAPTPNGLPASRIAKLSLHHGAARVGGGAARLRFESGLAIRGRLVGTEGRPIADALVDVLSRDRRAGAARAHIGTARTDGDGDFLYRLPAGPSRTVTFTYTAFEGEPRTAQASIITSVAASIAHPRFAPSHPHPGERVQFTGRLRYLPRGGVQIIVQFLDGHRWRTIGLTRTRSGGRFTWPYRFIRSAPGDAFTFRARVDSPVYPFAAGGSRAVNVRLAE